MRIDSVDRGLYEDDDTVNASPTPGTSTYVGSWVLHVYVLFTIRPDRHHGEQRWHDESHALIQRAEDVRTRADLRDYHITRRASLNRSTATSFAPIESQIANSSLGLSRYTSTARKG